VTRDYKIVFLYRRAHLRPELSSSDFGVDDVGIGCIRASGQSRNRAVADVVAAGNLSDWLALGGRANLYSAEPAGRDGVAGPRVNELILVPEDRIIGHRDSLWGGFCMTRQDEGGGKNSNMLSRRTLVGAIANRCWRDGRWVARCDGPGGEGHAVKRGHQPSA